jgi:hypothetical protein
MRLVDQWRRIRQELPDDWAEAGLSLTIPRAEQRARAGALLGPASPGRLGDELRLSVHRAGGGIGSDQLQKLLGKLDDERIRGTLTLLGAAEKVPRREAPRLHLAAAWDAELAALPPDWSDLLCEVSLTSSDHLARAATLLAPINPTRGADRSAFRFRVARLAGYGASPQMTRRCLERLDEDGLPGRLSVLRALSHTDNVATQGPVWRVGGKAV